MMTMILYHFSPVKQDAMWVNPNRMGSSINAGKEIQNQTQSGTMRAGFLKKSNWFTTQSTALELHRFGYMYLYKTELTVSFDVYDMDKDGFKSDIEIEKLGYIGYYTQGQVRLFQEVQAQCIGKIQLPQGETFKTIGNKINGENLEEYL
jgi:hypothetical protein